jgi:DNA-binding NarL/FixJ family response regulator
VKFHVSSLLRKLEAGNRTEAVAVAVERGLISL